MKRVYPPSDPAQKRQQRYGWYRKYYDFVGHPKWRVVAGRSGVHLAFVHVIVDALFQSAAKARLRDRAKNGYVGDFDFEECAAATDIPLEQVAAIVRALNDIGWIAQEWIVDWADRNPISDIHDAGATERQRNKRALDKAKKAIAMGIATSADMNMVSAEEREALVRLAKLSRVTAQAPVTSERPIAPLTLFEPADETEEARSTARAQNDHAARRWLFGSGGTDFGPASKIVADNFGCNRFSAHDMIIRWSRDLAGDMVQLAQIIDGAEQHALNGDAFQTVVRQRIDEAMRLRLHGPPLPLANVTIVGGRSRA